MLGPDFFARPTLTVARELIGKHLVRRVDGKTTAYIITETEGYFGSKDKGSHAHRGKTPRNTPMFARAGIIYVYFTYGMHWMLNLVCGDEGFPAAVLIRGLESPDEARLLNGPAKLTKYLKIDRVLNGASLGKRSGLWVEDRGIRLSPRDIRRTPRIGLGDRGVWTKKPWRFVLDEKFTRR
ncbi:DNA-3-methyladenine glycosylase [Candidatus Kaiserbacteria bacterium]|nr:DNA-3-methyladenine glycosylase [Candidatus Kaiserbacteria bacterium]